MKTDDGGRWVPTFAADSRPGDKIRMVGKPDRRIINRDYPDVWRPVLRVEFPGGVVETIAKTRPVEIWDPDGSVSQRVQDLSAAAIR
jgi:hypothetical protein